MTECNTNCQQGHRHLASRGGRHSKDPPPPPRGVNFLLGGSDPPPRGVTLLLGGPDPRAEQAIVGRFSAAISGRF